MQALHLHLGLTLLAPGLKHDCSMTMGLCCAYLLHKHIMPHTSLVLLMGATPKMPHTQPQSPGLNPESLPITQVQTLFAACADKLGELCPHGTRAGATQAFSGTLLQHLFRLSSSLQLPEAEVLSAASLNASLTPWHNQHCQSPTASLEHGLPSVA